MKFTQAVFKTSCWPTFSTRLQINRQMRECTDSHRTKCLHG